MWAMVGRSDENELTLSSLVPSLPSTRPSHRNPGSLVSRLDPDETGTRMITHYVRPSALVCSVCVKGERRTGKERQVSSSLLPESRSGLLKSSRERRRVCVTHERSSRGLGCLSRVGHSESEKDRLWARWLWRGQRALKLRLGRRDVSPVCVPRQSVRDSSERDRVRLLPDRRAHLQSMRSVKEFRRKFVRIV